MDCWFAGSVEFVGIQGKHKAVSQSSSNQALVAHRLSSTQNDLNSTRAPNIPSVVSLRSTKELQNPEGRRRASIPKVFKEPLAFVDDSESVKSCRHESWDNKVLYLGGEG